MPPARAIRRRRRRGWLGIAALALLGSAPAAQPPVLEHPAIDPAVLSRAAEVAYSKEIARARTAKTLVREGDVLRRARRDIEPLASYASEILPEAVNWQWSVNVERRNDALAICLPTAKILVSSALFDRAQLTDDEFSAILAHVIAHALIGHDANEAVAAYVKKRGSAKPDPDINRAALQLAESIGSVMGTAHYDTAAEQAADTVALELLARAGIDPGVAPAAWRKIAAQGGAVPDVAALHPVSPQRLAAIEAAVPGVMPLYRKALVSRPPAPPAPPPLRR